MEPINSIILNQDNYESEEAYLRAFATLIMTLTNEGYVCKVYRDHYFIAIEFEHGDEALGCPRLRWLTPEEDEDIYYQRRNEKKDD